VVAWDCAFNRLTTEDEALYFKDAETLEAMLDDLGSARANRVGPMMRRIAGERYLWAPVAARYFELLTGGCNVGPARVAPRA
jgi:hypothetical protein